MFFLRDLPTRAMLEGYAARFPEMDADAIGAALGRLRWASLLIRALDAYFAGHGLSQTQFLILIVIDREPDRDSLTAAEIADRLDVSRPIVSTTLKRLATAGLVTAGDPARDARAKPVALTEAGRERLAALLPGYYRLIQGHMEAPCP